MLYQVNTGRKEEEQEVVRMADRTNRLVTFKSVYMDIFWALTITHLRHLFVLKKYPIGNRDNNRFRAVLMLKK